MAIASLLEPAKSLKLILLVVSIFLVSSCGSSGSATGNSFSNPDEPTGGEIVDNPVPEPEPEPEPSNSLGGISSFQIVTDTGSDLVTIGDITQGNMVDPSSLPEVINFTAIPESPSDVGSVRLKISGEVSIDRIENQAPYTLERESVGLNIDDGQLPAGSYILSATPYSDPDGAGDVGLETTIAFSVAEPSIPLSGSTPQLLYFSLLTEDESDGVSQLQQLSDGSTIDLAQFSGQLLNFEAISSNPSETGSVSISLDGPVQLSTVRSEAPFLVTPLDQESFSIDSSALPIGDYVLKATPFEFENASGSAGEELSISFTVAISEQPDTDPENITAVDDFFNVLSGTTFTSSSSGLGSNDTFSSSLGIFTVLDNPDHGTLSLNMDGSFTYTPDNAFTGEDSFEYQIQQENETSNTATARLRILNQIDSAGFTAIVPSNDTKIVYVSSSVGSDSNNCLSEGAPCETVSNALEKMRDGYPDHMLLKRGDVWSSTDVASFSRGLPSGRSSSEPMVFSGYGSGERPVLDGHISRLDDDESEDNHFIHFIGLEFRSSRHIVGHSNFDPTSVRGFKFHGGHSNILVEDCIFNFVEFVGTAWAGRQPYNFVLRRNIFTGAYFNGSSFNTDTRPSNLYLSQLQSILIEENVFDHGGWNPNVNGAGANTRNHNVYISQDVNSAGFSFRNNIVTRGSSHGLQARVGGDIINNFFARNAVQLSIGYSQRALQAGDSANIFNNVISDTDTMFKGNPIADFSTGASTAVWGLDASDDMANADFIRMRNNIISGVIANGGIQRPFQRDSDYNGYDIQNSVVVWDTLQGDFTDSERLAGTFPAPAGFYPDPDRNLESYNQSLGGSDSFDEFMDTVLNRAEGTWLPEYTADAINDYIRAGFGLSEFNE